MSVLLLATWPAMGERERKRYLWWRYFGGSEWKCVEENGIWNFGKLEKALACGGRKEIKEKEKEKKFI